MKRKRKGNRVSKENPFSLNGKKILVLVHKGADVDAVSAAGILYHVLGKYNLVEIAVPEHLNRSAEKLAESMEIPYTTKPDFGSFNTLVIADLNSYNMLGSLAGAVRGFKGKKYLFDHHTLASDSIKADCVFSDEKAASTTEMLWLELKKHAIEPDETIALLTATGLLTDSAHFTFVSANSFQVMAEAMELAGVSLNEIQKKFSVKPEYSERIAVLKAARRSRIFRVGKHIAVTSEVGAFESQSASAFTRLGADVAFVAMKEKGMVRVSGRATTGFTEAFDLDLAKDVFQELSERFEGEGGGHVTAAAFTGKSNSAQKVLEECMSLMLEKIRKKKRRGLDFKEYK